MSIGPLPSIFVTSERKIDSYDESLDDMAFMVRSSAAPAIPVAKLYWS